MGQKPRYLTPTIFAKISSSCSNLIIIITCSVMNVSIFLYPSLTVESEVQLIFFVGETILPYKLRFARTKIRRPLWRNNFHANKANAFLYQICVLSDIFYTLKVAQETIRSTLLHRKKVRFDNFLPQNNFMRTIFFSHFLNLSTGPRTQRMKKGNFCLN